jgi:5-methylcytosine-specific restriction endonuclease McrA
MPPAPKPQHNRRVPKRSKRGEFSPKVREFITERDKGLCVRCFKVAVHIHHITFKSQGGQGTAYNGASVCYVCHSWAHSGREGREWFERWRETMLDEEGRYKTGE